MADYSEKLEDLLDHHLIDNEDLVKKKEMSGVGYLVNGNMCLGIYDDLLIVRIGESLAKSLVGRSGIQPYLPDEGLYDDFIMIDKKIYNHSKALHKFITQSLEYTSQLPPKEHGTDELDLE